MARSQAHIDPITISDDDESSISSDYTLSNEPSDFPESLSIQIDLSGSETNATVKDLPSYTFRGVALRPTTTVELEDGDFLLIRRVLQNYATREVFLEGHLFRRARQLGGIFEKKKNELAWIQKYDPNLDGDISQQSLHQIGIKRFVTVRDLILTNQLFPDGSYRENSAHRTLTKEKILRTCRLTCRWKYLSSGPKEGTILGLNETEVDVWHRVTDRSLKYSWRGSSQKGGSCMDWLRGEKHFDRAEQIRCNSLDPLGFRQINDPLEGPGQRYTFGDAFCGAGGVSRGAKAAGLRVHWGFDFSKAAIDSYRTNFSQTMCWCCPADTFVTAIPDDVRVDVLHLSPPCQPFSPMHVHAGQNDDANEASFFALGGIIKKVKPRIVMLEETFGLLRTADLMPWFRAMVQIFTQIGFSVRWKIFNLLDFGLPGRRQRIMLFASCPGEPLPDFPLPTHCSPVERANRPYLARHRTINDAISQIPATFSAHKDSKACNETTYDGDVPLPNTICCGTTVGKHLSSRNIHPSGKRTFTSRELACLNGFPLEHEFGPFGKTQLRKQIGNAVPPIVAKIFLEQIIKSMRKADGL